MLIDLICWLPSMVSQKGGASDGVNLAYQSDRFRGGYKARSQVQYRARQHEAGFGARNLLSMALFVESPEV